MKEESGSGIRAAAANDMHEDIDIKQFSASYTGDGKPKMDKNLYCRDQQELVIERVYINEVSVKEVVKAYLLDICRNGWYNQTNMIAAAQKEEEE